MATKPKVGQITTSKPRFELLDASPDQFEAVRFYDDAPAAPAPEEEGRTLGGTLKDVGISALKGAIAVPEAAVGLADLVTGGYAGKLLENEGGAVGFRPKQAKAALDEGYSAPQKAAFARVQAAEGLGDTFMAAVQNPSVIGQSVVESLPLMGAGGVVARGGLALAPRLAAAPGAGIVAGAVGEGAVGAGSAAESIRQQSADGLLTGGQAGLAAASGGATALFGYLGGKVAQKLGIADVDTMLAGAATNPALRKGVVRSALEGAFAEGVLEELPQSISEQVLQNIALDRPLDEGVNQAAVLGLLSGGLMGGGANVVNSLTAPAPSGLPEPAVKPTAAGQAPAAPPASPTPSGPLSRAASKAQPMAAEGLPLGASLTGQTGASLLQPQENELMTAIRQNEEDAAAQKVIDARRAAEQAQAPAADAGIPSSTAQPAPAGSFTSAKEAQDYISTQRRAASASLPRALPIQNEDGSFGVAVDGTQAFTVAMEQDRVRRLQEAGVQPDDVLNPKGEPFKTKASATTAAKKQGGQVVPVTGGFVVRKQQAVTDGAGAGVAPSGAASDGAGRTDAATGVGSGVPAAGRVAAKPRRAKAGGVGQSAELPFGAADDAVTQPAAEPAPAPQSTDATGKRASWVIREKATGKEVMETFDRKKVEALNTEKFEAVPIAEHLASLNQKKPTSNEQAPAKNAAPVAAEEGLPGAGAAVQPVEAAGVDGTTKKIENAKRRLREARNAGDEKKAQEVEREISELRQQAVQEMDGEEKPAQEFGGIEKALQAKSRDDEQDGDVAIVAGGGKIKYVSMDDAVQAARDAIKSGVQPVPFQIHNATGIRLGDTDKVIEAAKKPKAAEQPAEPFTHSGLKVYPTRVKQQDGSIKQQWAVQTAENAEREKRGERQIGGDELVDTREQAIQRAEEMAARAERDAKSRADLEAQERAQADKAAADKAEAEDIDGFMPNATKLVRGRIVKTLSTPITNGGKTTTRKALVRERVADGAKVEQAKEGRRLMMPSGTYLGEDQISKTAMDYAEHLIAQRGAAPAAKAEPRQQALDYIKWWRSNNPGKGPDDLMAGIYQGASFQVGESGAPFTKAGQIMVDGVGAADRAARTFKIKDLWGETDPAGPGGAQPASKTPTVDAHEKVMAAVREGTATPEQFKASFEAVVSSKEAIVAELSTKTKAELLRDGGYFLRMRYANESKPDIVDAFYRELVGEYVLGETLSYGMGKGAYEAAVRRHVEATDADKLAQYAKDRAAAVAEAQAKADARAEALKNPQTLDDYRNLLNAHIMTGKTRKEAFLMLTPEQRVQYDELEAESTREARERRKRELKTQVRAAGQTTGGEIIATKHTRDGYDLYVVQLADRVSKEDYKTLLSSAKRMGGWYSSFRGNGAVPGFQFKDRAQAEAFKALAGGDTAAAQAQVAARRDAFEDDRSQSAVERLTAMADKLDEQAQQAMNVERKTNTARRARFASAAEDAARQQQALAKTMRNIAQAIEGGRAKFLDSVRTKTQVEMLAGAVRTAKDNELRAKYDSYGEQQKRKGQPPTAETADYAEFPSFTAFRSDLASLARQMLEVEGTKKMGAQLMKVADDVTDAYMEFAKANQLQVSQFGNKAGGLANFSSREDAERAIKRSGLVGKAIVLPVKRGENRVILSPSEAINRGVWTGDGDKRITLSREFGQELVDAIGRRGNKSNGLSVPWQFESASDRLKAMARIGIETPAEFRSALREFIGLQEQAKEADRVKMLERDMVGRKNDGLDFFPTPQTVADQMVEAAGIEPDMAVLEPSAGMGHIADRIREAGAEPDVIEMANDRAELLEAKGFNVLARDFMEIKPRESYTFGDVFKTADGIEGIMRGAGGMGSNRVRLVNEAGDMLGYYDRDELTGVRLRGTESGYDRIIMNPPFSDRRDAEHVRHAFELLRPGGRLVAIMGEGVFFGKDKKAQDFRDWLEEKGGTAEKLPEGSFMDPTLPVNTAVNARMVVIDKPGAQAAKADDAPMFSRSKAARPVAPVSRNPDKTPLYEALRQLSRFDQSFQIGYSEAKELDQIARDMTAGRDVSEFIAEKSTELHQGNRKPTLTLKTKNKAGEFVKILDIFEADSATPFVVIGNSELGQNVGGAYAYQMAFTWAHNNGKRMVPDPAGLTVINRLRRTEAMISSALRHGTTKHLEPHVEQYVALTERMQQSKQEPEDLKEYSRPDLFAQVDALKNALWTNNDDADSIASNVQHLAEASAQLAAFREPNLRRLEFADGALRKRGDVADIPLEDADIDGATGKVNIRGVVLQPARSGVGSSTVQRYAVVASVGRALQAGKSQVRGTDRQDGGVGRTGSPALAAIRQVLGDISRGPSDGLKGVFYSRGQQAGALTRESTQQIADAISAQWANAPEIIVARDMSDYVIPQRVREHNDAAKSAGATGEPEGFIYQGKVYLIADQLRSSQDVARVLFHEALGHAGLRGVFGDELKPILRQIAVVRAKDVRAKAKEYGLDMAKEADRLQAAEEVLANMAQTAPELGFVKRAIAAIRTWLRNNVALFRDIDVTDDEIIRDYILPARGFIERGREAAAPKALPVFSRNIPDLGVVDEDTEALVQEFGEPIATKIDAERRHAAGDRIFAMHEMADTLSEITSVRQLKNWAPDLLVAVPRAVFENDAAFSRADQTNTPAFRKLTELLGSTSAARDMLSSSDKSVVDSLERNAKGIADFLKSHAVGSHGKGQVNIPSSVVSHVLKVADNKQIFGAIVRSIPVDVVDLLARKQLSPDGLLRDKSMLENVLAVDGAANVSLAIDKSSALALLRSVARTATEIATNLTGGALESGSATGAGQGDSVFGTHALKVTETSSFSKWFGDSKVVDAQGKPLVVYHGTHQARTKFTKAASFFTDSPANASQYAEDRAMHRGRGDSWFGGGSSGVSGALIQPVYLSMAQPLIVDAQGQNWAAIQFEGEIVSTDQLVEIAKARGSDGLIVRNVVDTIRGTGEPATTYAVFRPEQIKSATGNRGTFDADNPDIRYSRAAVSNLANRATDLLNDALSHPGKLSFWDKSVGSMYHIAQRYPAFRRVFNSAQNFINDVSYYATEAAEQAPKILPRLETWRDLAKSPIKAADNNAIARPILEGTLSWTRDEDGSPVRVDDIEAAGIVWRDGELRSMFNLTDDQIALYREFRAATDLSLDNMGKADLLRYAGKDLEDLRDMVMDAPDVMAAAKVMRGQLQELADADPERSKELIAMAGDLEKRAERVQNLKRDGYAPLSRFGRYTVDVVVDGERRYFSLFDTARDANKMAAKMRAEFGADAVSQGTLSQREFEAFQGITPESLELFGNMLGLDSTGDEAQDKVFQTYLKLTKANRSALKRLIHRKGVAGYSDDMGRVLAAFVYSNARQTSAALHMGEMGQAVQEIPKGQGELKDVAIELSSYIKQPREEAQALRGLLFAQYLGGSVASAFVNFTQPFTVTFPYLIRFGGARRSAQALMKAMADQRDGVKLEEGLARALKTAEEQGVVAPQEVHQLMAQARGESTLKAGDGTRAGEALAATRNAWTRTTLAWGKMFGMAEQINRRSTFIAAYRIAAERGMRNPAAFATKAVNETQFVNNRANKARWARGPVGATLMTFKSYSVHYMELMHRLATREGPEGKKAAAMMLGMLLLVAGAGGLPFVEDAEDVVDMIAQRMGYNFSSKQAKRQFLEDLFGKAGAQFVEKGVTGLAGSPIDISGRMSMANLIPGTGLLLKKPDQSRDMQELVGPVGDLVKRGWKGADLALSGEFGKALLEVSPRAVANAAKGVDMANTGVYTDTRGRKVIETDLGDAVAKAIGFQPQSVAQVQDATFTVQKMVSQNKMREAEIAEKWAQGIYEGNKAKIEEARQMVRDWNRKNPKTPIKIELPQILKRVRAMRMSKEDRIAKTAPSEIRGAVQRELAAQ